MSSVYGPALLKNPTVEDNVDEAVGRKKNSGGEEFETDHDRAKRIRRERKAMKAKDLEDNKKQLMSQAINALLSGGSSSSTSTGKSVAKAGPAAPQFLSFGPTVGPA
eukprot:CAMPEP_0170251126 /NCGR_PEP_ID=MMETSP0116_2-20130129/25392_1 /TAXON_ID=400756 /ORGANISM="Durinskia baltica, Strain CSIRO CS-38" /LENGTH=106 /DNA_ID=CAMNT_0010502087 /DNA_START=51 /DNA_END=367 /DNA_ORIENTATION=+